MLLAESTTQINRARKTEIAQAVFPIVAVTISGISG